MYWVLQENIFKEKAFNELLHQLVRLDVPHSQHKVIPFIGEILPDINPEGPVVVFGSYSMRHTAKKKGWTPGVWEMDHFQFNEQVFEWGRENLLNGDATIEEFQHISTHDESYMFYRPLYDSKVLAGTCMYGKDFNEWQNKVVNLEEDYGTSLNKHTLIMVCCPKTILQEYRFWIIDEKIITSSVYKIGNRVTYNNDVPNDAHLFAASLIKKYNPQRAFVIDVALMSDGNFKVVEAQCINASGFYAADIQKLIIAIEGMEYENH